MLETRGGLSFDPKALDKRLARQFAEKQQLERDDPVQTLLSRSIDNPHPAARDFFEQFEVAQRAWDERGRGNG